MKAPELVWREPPQVAIPTALREAVDGGDLFCQALTRRGLVQPERARAFLDPDSYQPASPGDLPDLERAVDLLLPAIRSRKKICVWGDFDVDGQTATTLLVETLRGLGADVRFHIPVRAYESHGVNVAGLEREISQGAELILTCDTGVTALEAVELARERGVACIITDHHDLPPQLPPAEAVINPKRLVEGHALRGLPGVGVAYELALALCQAAGQPETAERCLDLVALGIVADLAEQTQDTRYLLQRGLKLLREQPRMGLRVLMELAEVDPLRLSEEHIGFILGPRLNALGRLADANPAVEFLTTADPARARILAAELESLNARRRLLCEQVFQAAQAQIERDPGLLDSAALVLAHPTWPAGVIGIVASRLVDLYQRPTILIASPPGELARGSARSVSWVNVSAAISAVGNLLQGFGGHPMAAGLGMQPERIPEFQRAFCQAVQAQMGERLPEKKLQIDGRLALAELTLDLVQDIERLAPFGPGNPALTLMTPGLVVKSSRQVGRNGEHLQLVVEDEAGTGQKVVWWQSAGQPLPQGKFDLAYTVRASNYRGKAEIQVEWIDARVVEQKPVELRGTRPQRTVVDYRRTLEPARLLRGILKEGPVQVWGEGEAPAEFRWSSRLELVPGLPLVVWSAPPGHAELAAAVEQAAPPAVYLFAHDPGLDELQPFLRRLMGLVKYTLQALDGRADLHRMAAALSQRVETIRWGIGWLETRGDLALLPGEGDAILRITGWQADGSADPQRAKAVEAILQALLAETAAYRAYFRQAGIDSLF